MKSLNDQSRGFTLLELLIVIAIIAILAAFLVWVLNPAETLRKGRDSQRMSDLKTLHRSLGLYITVVSNPTSLYNNCGAGVFICTTFFSGNGDPATRNIIGGGITGIGVDCPGMGTMSYNTTRQDITNIDGSGWVPADFRQISGGSPISRLPLDPNFSVSNRASVDMEDPVNDRLYVFVCKEISLEYEIIANLESNEFRKDGPSDKESTDGGDRNMLYEVGTNLRLLQFP